MKNNKIINIVSLVFCVAGLSLYIYAILGKAELDNIEYSIEYDVKELERTLGQGIRYSIKKLDAIESEAIFYSKESEKIYDFFYAYNDNLNKYFGNLSKDGWSMFEGRSTPDANNFGVTYSGWLKNLSNKHKAILLPSNNEGHELDVSASFTNSIDGISYLNIWGDGQPLKGDIFPAMRKYRIAEALCESISRLSSYTPIITSIQVPTFTKNTNEKIDFDHLEVILKCDLTQTGLPELVRSILTNQKLLFDLSMYKMYLPVEKTVENPDPNRMTAELTIKVLMIKDETKNRKSSIKIDRDNQPIQMRVNPKKLKIRKKPTSKKKNRSKAEPTASN